MFVARGLSRSAISAARPGFTNYQQLLRSSALTHKLRIFFHTKRVNYLRRLNFLDQAAAVGVVEGRSD
jgi:hypothetical protein